MSNPLTQQQLPPLVLPKLLEPDVWRILDSTGRSIAIGHLGPTMLDEARRAKEHSAHPGTSNFSVGAAFLLSNGCIVSGANFEYGGGMNRSETRGVHGEESAMVNALRLFGDRFRRREISISAVAVTADTPGAVTCCGNCLDVVRSFAEHSAIPIIGSGLGQEAVIWSLEQVFPTSLPTVRATDLSADLRGLLLEARAAAGLGFDLFSRARLGHTGAALLTDSGNIYAGAREDNAAYHPISALDAAIVHSRAHGDPFAKAVALVSDTLELHGRDRQRVFERADELGRLDELMVLVATPDLKEIRMATPRHLLPFGFGARSLGMIDQVQQELLKYRFHRT